MTSTPFNRQILASPSLHLALLPLALLSGGALAQNTPALAIPGAGQALQQLEPPTKTAPASAATPALRIAPPASASPRAGDTTPIDVTSIEVTGNTVFDTATLKALVSDAEGSRQSLGQLEALAQRITAYYQNHGQPLANAYLPVQTLDNGVLRIVVVEVVYGRIKVDNQSRISTAQLEAFTASLKPGQLVAQAPLERTLLLTRELAGINVSAQASPGSLAGTTDLTISAVDTPRASGTYSLDNQGSKAAGRARALVSAELNNQLGQGETFTVLGLTSGQGLNYGRLGLQMPVDASGTRVGVGFARLHYSLGDVFANLQANGSAQVLDGFVQQALMRSTTTTLNTEARVERKTLKDRVDLTGTRTYRTVTSVSAGLNGEHRDQFASGGSSRFALGYSVGRVAFDNSAALALDQSASGAHTQGRYGRVNLEVSRLQGLGTAPALVGTTLFGSLRAQVASTNLDSSEQTSIAGPQGVRGYDLNALLGAQGYVANVELRQLLNRSASGIWQATAFFDMGQASVYKNAFTPAQNRASMSSVGLGINWVAPTGWNASLTLARPVGSTPAIAAVRSGRAWLMIGNKL